MNIFKKRVGISCLLLMVLSNAMAQTSQNDAKYIEVTISDSAEINPDLISYKITLSPENNVDEYTEEAVEEDTYNNPPSNTNYAETLKKKQEESALKIKILEKRFSDILAKEKITFTREEDNSYAKYMYGDYNTALPKAFVLKFTSFSQVNKFLEKIPEDIKYIGNISDIASSKYREEESKLLEKTLTSARKQALTIASLSNIKIGSVIQFSDNEGDNLIKGLERLMYALPKMYERDKFLNATKKIIIMKTVRVRYSIE